MKSENGAFLTILQLIENTDIRDFIHRCFILKGNIILPRAALYISLLFPYTYFGLLLLQICIVKWNVYHENFLDNYLLRDGNYINKRLTSSIQPWEGYSDWSLFPAANNVIICSCADVNSLNHIKGLSYKLEKAH